MTVVFAPGPDWLLAEIGVAEDRPRAHPSLAASDAGDKPDAVARFDRYLQKDAPKAVEGKGGDATTVRVAMRGKDFGLSERATLSAMRETWNDGCLPPWNPDDLAQKVANAYLYGSEEPGVADPANAFTPVHAAVKNDNAVAATEAPDLSPHEALNAEYAYCLVGDGDMVLRETKDAKGNFHLSHLAIPTFNRLHAAKKITYGNKTVSLAEDWMQWSGRRSYNGLVFMPEQEAPAGWYNLWRGFAVEPLAPGEEPTKIARQSVDDYFGHILENVCNGNKPLAHWLIGYLAHMIQRPWEKPLVALVFKGAKGVGKNVAVERVGCLLGNHFLVATHNRYLTSNFNGHLENCLMMVLDEAAWAGDKKTEGVLKGLVTGGQHIIEQKGASTYTVDNLIRIAVLGNEDWLVPASHDERRFAVFNVGNGRRQDRAFFKNMRLGMEGGGYRLLLRRLLDYDISDVDVDAAPATEGLAAQKLLTMQGPDRWLHDCLQQARVVGANFSAHWTEDGFELDKTQLYDAYKASAKDHREFRPQSLSTWGRAVVAALGTAWNPEYRPAAKGGNPRPRLVKAAPLSEARQAFERYLGHKTDWETDASVPEQLFPTASKE